MNETATHAKITLDEKAPEQATPDAPAPKEVVSEMTAPEEATQDTSTREGIVSITIDEEFKGLLPALSKETYAMLEENLLENGCRDALGRLFIIMINNLQTCQRQGGWLTDTESHLPQSYAMPRSLMR